MPPKRPRVGEQPLPGMADPTPPVRDMTSKNSFARAATPEYWGLDPNDYVDIDSHMLELASPVNLRTSLIDVPRNSQFAVSYIPGGEPSPARRIALTPMEYGLITRSVPSLQAAIIGRTLASRPGRRDFTADVNAARRSGVHALAAKQKDMQTYLTGTIETDIERLTRFDEAASHPGYWRAREGEMRIELEWIREHIFGDMFMAIRYQRGWSPEQEDLARRAVDRRLFFERQRNQHLQNWRDMFALNLDYLGNKKALLSDRIWQAKKIIGQNQDTTES